MPSTEAGACAVLLPLEVLWTGTSRQSFKHPARLHLLPAPVGFRCMRNSLEKLGISVKSSVAMTGEVPLKGCSPNRWFERTNDSSLCGRDLTRAKTNMQWVYVLIRAKDFQNRLVSFRHPPKTIPKGLAKGETSKPPSLKVGKNSRKSTLRPCFLQGRNRELGKCLSYAASHPVKRRLLQELSPPIKN